MALATVVLGCGTFGTIGATPAAEIPEEHMPAPASLRLSGDPDTVDMPITVSLLTGDPGWSREGVFAPGDPIVVDFGVSNGEYRLVSDLPACSLVVSLAPDAETDVVMRILDPGACRFDVVGVHPLDVPHEATESAGP